MTVIVGMAAPGAAQQVPTEPASTHIFPAGGRRGASVAVRVGGEFLPPHTRFRMVGEGVTCQPELVEKATANYELSPRRKPGGTPINYPREWRSEITIAADAPLGQKLWRVSSARGGTGGRPFIVGDLPEFIEAESNSTPTRAERIVLPVTINGQIAGERDLDYFRFEAAAGDVVSLDVAAARLGSPLDPVVEIQDSHGRRVAVEETRAGSDPVIAVRVPASGEYWLLVSNLNFRGGPQYVYRITASTAPAAAATIPVESSDLATVVETEPNDSAQAATAVSWPAVVNGRFSTKSDDDWYAIVAGKDQAITFECRPVPQGSGSLPVISICDSDGRQLARASTVELLPKPCRLEWRAPSDGKYLCRVRDVHIGPGENKYSLSIRPTRPDFSLSATADFANVVQGARGELEIKVDRQGGLSGPIELAIEGLPEGVRAEPSQIPAGQDAIKLAFIATDDTRPGDALLAIQGSIKLGDETITRRASAAHLGRDVEGVSLGSPTVDHIQLTVRHKQVFRLFCSEAYQYASRGTIYPYQMEVERLNGFDGPIMLEIADRQIMDLDGVEIVNSTFPAGTSKIMLPLYLPENMHINVQPHSNIYAQGYVVFQDKWGVRQSMLQVSEMRCMIRPLPTVARLRAREKSIFVGPGQTRTCTLHLDRTTNFTGEMSVTLAEPVPGIHIDPVVIPRDQSAAVVTVVADQGMAVSPKTQLILRGVGNLPGGVKVVSEVTLPVAGE